MKNPPTLPLPHPSALCDPGATPFTSSIFCAQGICCTPDTRCTPFMPEATKPKAPLTPEAHTTPVIFVTPKTPAAPETPVAPMTPMTPGEPGQLQQSLRRSLLYLLPPNLVRHHWNLFPSWAVRVPNHFLCPDQKKKELSGRIMKFYYESLLFAACWKQAQNYSSPSNNPCLTNCNKISELPSCPGPSESQGLTVGFKSRTPWPHRELCALIGNYHDKFHISM